VTVILVVAEIFVFAVIFAVFVDFTTLVVIGKVAVVAPSRIVTLAGTVATVFAELVRVTTTPPAPAGAPSVTVPVIEFPPTTELGDADTLIVVGVIVNLALMESPPSCDAVRVTAVFLKPAVV
jgi:hypothetical protein